MVIAFIPKVILKLFYTDYLRQYELNILLSNILLIVVFVVFGNSLIGFLNLIPHFCLFDKIVGIPCPFCGITRGLCEISKGNIGSAFELNVASFFIALFFLSQIPFRILTILNPNTLQDVTKYSNMMGNILLILIGLNWMISIWAI